MFPAWAGLSNKDANSPLDIRVVFFFFTTNRMIWIAPHGSPWGLYKPQRFSCRTWCPLVEQYRDFSVLALGTSLNFPIRKAQEYFRQNWCSAIYFLNIGNYKQSGRLGHKKRVDDNCKLLESSDARDASETIEFLSTRHTSIQGGYKIKKRP